MSMQRITRLAIAAMVSLVSPLHAATLFSDDFGTSTLNGTSVPTTSATSYDIASSKNSSGCSIAAGNFKILIPATTSGFVEAQALFADSPIALNATGDYVELTATFTADANIISGISGSGSFLCYGLFNSGGSVPLTILANSGLSATTGSPNSTGGVQNWQGYVSRVATLTANSTIITRPAQSGADTSSQNQDLIGSNWGGGAFDTPTGVTLGSLTSTASLTDLQQYTLTFRITLTGANTFSIESKIYNGVGTGGTVVFNQTATAAGANFLTSSFDGLAIGYRYSGTSAASSLTINSLLITTSVPVSPGNNVAGIYFQQQPTDAIAGATIAPSVSVVATNSIGGPATNIFVDLALLSGSGPLNGTLSQLTDASGKATYNNLSLTTSGAKQLRATSGSAVTDSAIFNISTAPAAQLVFTTQPSDAGLSATITPPVVVQLRDVYGNNVSSNATVTLTMNSGTGTLTGGGSLATDGTGKATFSNLSINLSGAKQLTAAKAGLPSVASSTFTITNSIVAFPGAEGAGANALGGRGGDVYYVTTLADSGVGSLRTGISTAPAGGRTICFKVSGNIVLNSTLTVNKPRITIAGQTAPGDGICFQNNSFNINANDVIVRHIRTRLGTNALAESDCMWIAGGTNVIVDHVSASWSVDEVLSATGNLKDLSVQWCYITESLNNSIHTKGAHGYGTLLTPSVNGTISWHHNLYAHNNSRNPRPGTDSGATVVLDFRNNSIYNYGGRAGYGSDWDPDPENLRMNYIANYIIKGPSSTYNYAYQGGGTNTFIYQATNLIDLNLNSQFDGVDSGFGMFSPTYLATNTPFDAPLVTTDPAPVALQRVLATGGAMPWRRDSADQRIIGTVRSHTGQIIDAVAQVGTWPTLNATTPPTDTDSDGMPDYWELANGLNPNNAADRNTIDSSGYTELEVYLNWLADAHALCDRNGQVDVDLRAATGGATNLTYTVANDDNGTVSLLGDGFTARFSAAANTNASANFTFTATGDGVSFGPINYGVLITTTNAPVSNTAPTLSLIADRTVIAGNTVSFTNSASDTDVPAQTLTFTLLGGLSGTSLNSSNSIFNWRPTIAQSPSTNLMSVIVTDNGTPSLTATQSFTVYVTRPTTPSLQPGAYTGGDFPILVSGDAGPDYTVEASTNLVNWLPLFTTNSPALPFNWSDPNAASFNQRYFRIMLGP